MSTQRYISTSFWDDDWISALNPTEKLVYLYLLTNPLTNIAGVYKLTIRRICFDTGIKEQAVKDAMASFSESKKAYFFGEYIIIPAWPRHQRWETKETIKRGIQGILLDLPKEVVRNMVSIGYQYPMDSVGYPPSYLDSDSDSDSDSSASPEGDALSGCQEQPDSALADFLASEKSEDKMTPVQEIIAYLNDRCKSRFNEKSAATRSLVKARWREGYRLPDFKAVIDVKARQWLSDAKMAGYLRPTTLFSASKFDGYLQEARKVPAPVEKCGYCGVNGGMHAESCPKLRPQDQ